MVCDAKLYPRVRVRDPRELRRRHRPSPFTGFAWQKVTNTILLCFTCMVSVAGEKSFLVRSITTAVSEVDAGQLTTKFKTVPVDIEDGVGCYWLGCSLKSVRSNSHTIRQLAMVIDITTEPACKGHRWYKQCIQKNSSFDRHALSKLFPICSAH
jgi:hypothetical protein